jgi:hypothetical protein
VESAVIELDVSLATIESAEKSLSVVLCMAESAATLLD